MARHLIDPPRRVTMEERKASLANFEPGLYRGGSNPIFGLWRLTQNGIWLFSVPVEGDIWQIADDQTGDKLKLLVANGEH